MTTELLFKNQHYSACVLCDGSLVISYNRKRGGKRLVGEQAKVWIEAIRLALDSAEANALCRGFLTS